MFVTPISLPLKPIGRSTAVVLFSLLEPMGAFWDSYSPVFANWRFLQIRQSIFVYSLKDREKRKKIGMEYNSCYILYIEL